MSIRSLTLDVVEAFNRILWPCDGECKALRDGSAAEPRNQCGSAFVTAEELVEHVLEERSGVHGS